MKKKIMYILLFLTFLLIPFIVNAEEEKNLVNIYLFHSATCPHCREEIRLLDELEKEYDNIKIYKFEISEEESSKLLAKVSDIYKINTTSVPFTVIGTKTFSGYSSENSKERFMGAIEYYSQYGYVDEIAKIKDYEEPSYEVNNDISIDEYLNDYGNYTFDLPFIGKVNTKDLALPIIAIVMGMVDGFNPCAMWILIFLITMLIGIKDKKRMWILGLSFILTSGIMYFLIMLAWLNVASVITKINVLRLIVGIIAIIGGCINILSIRKKDDGCSVTDKKDRKKIMDKIKSFTKEKSLLLAIIGVVSLAISVNLIELACSLGLPVMFSQILAINNIGLIGKILYILLYIFFFLIDDLIVFLIAATSFKVTALSTKYAKISKIIGGFILLIIGIFMILKPEWLMLGF